MIAIHLRSLFISCKCMCTTPRYRTLFLDGANPQRHKFYHHEVHGSLVWHRPTQCQMSEKGMTSPSCGCGSHTMHGHYVHGIALANCQAKASGIQPGNQVSFLSGLRIRQNANVSLHRTSRQQQLLCQHAIETPIELERGATRIPLNVKFKVRLDIRASVCTH